MKRFIHYLLIMQLALSACSNEVDHFDSFLGEWELESLYNNNPCKSESDAFIFPKKWTADDLRNYEQLPGEFFRSMSACGLLTTLLEHPTNQIGPWCTYCNNLLTPGVTRFNNYIRDDRVTDELFSRDGLFPVMASKYLIVIREKKESFGQVDYLEMLLASDMFVSILTEKEKIILMAMVLQRIENKTFLRSSTQCIMISIMKSCNYEPFMTEVYAELSEWMWGYCIVDSEGNIKSPEGIEKYAKQFLNEKK